MEAPKFKYGDKWNLYLLELDKYFEKQRLDECQKSGVLLLNICPKTLKILKNLCLPRTPNTMKYGQLCQKLGKEFTPKISDYRERVKFYDLKQKKDESVSLWLKRVQHGATSCNFGKFFEEKVKEKFVTGLCKGQVLDRLFEERPKQSFKELFNIALHAEKQETPSHVQRTPSAQFHSYQTSPNPYRNETVHDTLDSDFSVISSISRPSPDRGMNTFLPSWSINIFSENIF